MPDLLTGVLATPGLFWLIATIGAAGIVRGFTGFGTALIFVPVAAMFLPAADVVALITMTGIASTAALLPRAMRTGDVAEVGVMALAALVTVPLGLWLLSLLDQIVIRWLAAGVAGAMLGALVAGWRFSGEVRKGGLLGVGGAAGLIGGLTGLTGPAVILFYLSGAARAEIVRANTIIFLAALDVVIVANLMLRGMTDLSLFLLAMLLAVPYFATTMLGQALFDPGLERFYRWAAYGVIALAVVTGLPIWQQGG